MPATRTIDIGGPVHVAEWGGEGAPLLLVHGLGGSLLDWSSVAPTLARGHRVVALDLPGFGLSPRAGRSSAVTANADVVARAIETLGLVPVTLVANSMGGLISLLVAERRPDLVERLVLVDPAIPAPLTARPDAMVILGVLLSSLPGVGGRLVSRRGRRLGPEGIVDQTLRLCCVDPSRVPAEQRQAFIEQSRERRRTTPDAPDAYSEAARSITAALVGPLGRRAAGRVRTPMLVVHGRRDRLVNLRAAELFVKDCPERRLAIIEDCGHIPMVELPDQFLDAVLPWLEERRRSAA